MILIIVATATGYGLKLAISQKIVGFTGHISLSAYNLNNSYENAPLVLNQEDSVAVSSLEKLDYYQPYATKAGILKGKEDFEGVVLKGVNGSYNWQFFEANLRTGNLPNFADSTRSNAVLLSKTLSNRLKVDVNDTVKMYFIQEPPKPPRIRSFIVSGIYETGLEEYDKNYLICDIRHIQSLNGWRNGEVGGYEIVLKNDENLEIINANLRQNLSYEVDARTVRSQNEQLYQWLDLFDLNLYLIIGIMLAVAIINMISALLILILDRTKMIGLLKALGAKNWQVMQIFLYQSASIILKGMFWGNVIGLGFCFLQLQFGIIPLDPETYYVSSAPIYLNFGHILVLNIGVFVLCILALIIPAAMVAYTSPVKALRYE